MDTTHRYTDTQIHRYTHTFFLRMRVCVREGLCVLLRLCLRVCCMCEGEPLCVASSLVVSQCLCCIVCGSPFIHCYVRRLHTPPVTAALLLPQQWYAIQPAANLPRPSYTTCSKRYAKRADNGTVALCHAFVALWCMSSLEQKC